MYVEEMFRNLGLENKEANGMFLDLGLEKKAANEMFLNLGLENEEENEILSKEENEMEGTAFIIVMANIIDIGMIRVVSE